MSTMAARLYRTCAIALVLYLGGALPAAAQEGAPLNAVVPVQALAFDPLVPGVETRVRATDVSRRAEWRLEGSGEVDVVLQLPEALEGPEGLRIPLDFGYGDVAVAVGGEMVWVDPTQPFSLHLPPEGVRLLVGGTARPGLEELAGEYRADIQVLLVHRE